MSAKWIKTKISALANDMTDGPFGSDLKMVHYTDKREARIVQLSNVGEDGWLDENIKYTTFSHAHEIGRCIIEPGNIIVAKMMPAGRAILCPNHEPMFVQGSDVVKIVPNDRINPTFFVYMTKQNDYLKQIEKNTQGSTRSRTSISKLKEISLTIPESKVTQNKLAQILVTCDIVIQNTQKTIDKYKAIKQGMMQDLFTRGLTKDGKLRPPYKEAPELYKESELGMIPKEWEVKLLESYVEDISDGPFGSNLKAIHYTEKKEVRIIQLGNIGEDGWIDDNVRYTTFTHASEISRCIVSPGEIVIAKMMPAGRTIICPSEEKKYVLSSDGIRVIFNSSLLNKYYFRYFTKTHYFLDQINKDIQGSTRARTSILKLKAMDILHPSIEEQAEIANRLSAIDSTIQEEEAILEKYKNIKTGLMARLLTPPKDAEIIDETGE